MDKKLFLIDAMALIYRSFYALNKNPRINSKGLNTSATLGFFNTLLDLMQKHKPSHLAVCFDVEGGSFRNEEFEQYKANREAMPEDIKDNIPYIKNLLKAMNIKTIGIEGYEADDVIGTLSKKAKNQGFETYMVTPDKDYGQLVGEGIFILKLPHMGTGETIMGVKEVLEKFEIRDTKQVIDILGLWGDSSDNIPGVKGIGEKKAKALLQQFDSIEDILANTDKIESKSIRKAIEENREAALMSKQLATIRLDVPVDFIPEEFLIGKPDLIECKRLFDDLEFRKFAQRFFAYYSAPIIEPVVDKKPETQPINIFSMFDNCDNINDREHNYQTLTTLEEVQDLKEKLLKAERFAFDVKLNGSGVFSTISAIAFCINKDEAYYLANDIINQSKDYLKEVFFSAKKILKICYDLKYKKSALLDFGIVLDDNCFDVLIAHYLIASEQRNHLEDMALTYLSYTMQNPDLQNETTYCERADICLQLHEIFSQKLEQDNLKTLFQEVEMPLIEVLMDMEREGVSIDTKILQDYSCELAEEKTQCESEIYRLANKSFNIASPRQLGEVLFDEMKLQGDTKAKKTKTKQYSTSEEVLQKLIDIHPIIPLILRWREITKLKNTYVDALPLCINPKTGKIHAAFNQAVTATGRLSSANPNLQNLPIRRQKGKPIRKAFVPSSPTNKLLSADYSQIELRIIASLSGDEHMCQAFKQGKDIHRATAAKVFSVSEDEVSTQMRSMAKSVNFGIIYGISAFGLSEDLHIPRAKAQKLIDDYFAVYPKIREFINEKISFAQEHGYAQTIMHRRRYLRNINSKNGNLRAFDQRNAVNMTIQGTSADMIKMAMVNIHRKIKDLSLKSKMIMQIHDELVFDVANDEIEIMQKLVEEQMQNALPLENVPIIVEPNCAHNLLDTH